MSSLGLDAVNISFLTKETNRCQGQQGTNDPLIITPRWDDSLTFLNSWLKANREWLDGKMLQHGAILIRGFAVNSPADMEFAIKGYQPNLNNTYRGTSPRINLEGTEYVFSAAEVPTNYPIAQHIEMSFLPEPPKQLFFCCLKPSKSAGGETALADFRRVYDDIPTDLKQKFLDKGIRYTRTHKKKGAYFTYDVSDMLGWPELFGTDSKEKVEEICKAENIPMKWVDNDTFVATTQSHAYQLHPVTQEHVWFNHTQVFHWSTFPAELWFAFCRTHELKLLLHFIFVSIFCIVKYAILGHKMSLHTTFGDGEEISFLEMQQVRDAIHKNMIFSRWQKGDLLFIDNFSTSHGRQPTYDKGRKIAVAWSDPIKKANAVVSLEPVFVENRYSVSMVEENPQEKSPCSTLTRSDSAALNENHRAKELEQKMMKFSSSMSSNPQNEGAAADNLKGLFHRRTHSYYY